MPSMTATKDIKYARTIVCSGEATATYMKRNAARRNRRANRQRLHEQGAEYEPALIRVTGWDVA